MMPASCWHRSVISTAAVSSTRTAFSEAEKRFAVAQRTCVSLRASADLLVNVSTTIALLNFELY